MTSLSPIKAIRAKCVDCIYDPLAKGGQVTQIENCTSPSCPLHEHRAISSATKQKRKEERLSRMTPEERVKYDAKSAEIGRRLRESRQKSEN